jgi:fumarate reductase subunit D
MIYIVLRCLCCAQRAAETHVMSCHVVAQVEFVELPGECLSMHKETPLISMCEASKSGFYIIMCMTFVHIVHVMHRVHDALYALRHTSFARYRSYGYEDCCQK